MGGNLQIPLINDDHGPELKPSQVLTIIGWPKKETQNSSPEMLKNSDLELLTNEECNQLYVNTTIFGDMMCAGGGKVGSCAGKWWAGSLTSVLTCKCCGDPFGRYFLWFQKALAFVWNQPNIETV